MTFLMTEVDGGGAAAAAESSLAPLAFTPSELTFMGLAIGGRRLASLGPMAGMKSTSQQILLGGEVDGQWPNQSLLHGGLNDCFLGRGTVHPVERLQQQHLRRQEEALMRRSAIAYGLHAPFNMTMQRELICQSRRLPGLKSSFLGLEVLMGNDSSLDISEVFNTPENNPECCNLTPAAPLF